MTLAALNFFGESNFDVEEPDTPVSPEGMETTEEKDSDPTGSLSADLALTPRTPMKPEGDLGFPPTLPVELALKTATVDEICAAYGYTQEAFLNLVTQPAFAAAYKEAQELVQEEGMAFKMKAKMQAEAMLQTSWAIVHDVETPSSVRADLIKSTVRWAGYEPKTQPQEQSGPGLGGGLNIQINLG